MIMRTSGPNSSPTFWVVFCFTQSFKSDGNTLILDFVALISILLALCLFLFMSLNGVVAKDNGMNVSFWHVRYWKVLMLLRVNKMEPFVRGWWIFLAINEGLNTNAYSVLAPFQGQLYLCDLLCLTFLLI